MTASIITDHAFAGSNMRACLAADCGKPAGDHQDSVPATCPKCDGTTRRPVPEDSRKYIKHNARWGHWNIGGYQPAGPGPFADGTGYEGGTLPCDNCGGQTMSSSATGQVPRRADGTPCLHEYSGQTVGRCYHRYTCKHCEATYYIDSGD